MESYSSISRLFKTPLSPHFPVPSTIYKSLHSHFAASFTFFHHRLMPYAGHENISLIQNISALLSSEYAFCSFMTLTLRVEYSNPVSGTGAELPSQRKPMAWQALILSRAVYSPVPLVVTVVWSAMICVRLDSAMASKWTCRW